eukprot:CAMPEP_0114608976 /NCGR_PEP_ID=MMETSP0168-20121206/2853_1 /TAXON_ID=95228 ORGANISM="Vannella sp., Strain DIVA3 517/6/12" /NCGR_SAMPLE_ID=MMETSP0168 /ASSEMBLY_ACC=CAM_ASM_000044 /LENGTH=296 /DNA_ID=CAMNT_0001819885 /DNA_START=6 /DNA_END=893 /DNA_ORIENTATION=-
MSYLKLAYWRSICGTDAITDDPDLRDERETDSGLAQRVGEDWRKYGYTRVGGFFGDSIGRLEVLAEAARRLENAGWPPTFVILLNDAWWAVARAQREIFRENALLCNGDFYAWTQTSGWSIHRDRDDHRCVDSITAAPLYATLWIPLTEATPANGCVYVVPKERDEGYLGDCTGSVSTPDIVALPASVGDVLSWTGRALHFGGRPDEQQMELLSSRGVARPRERIALSLAFSNPSFEAAEEHGLETEVLTPNGGERLVPPSVSERLELAVVQLLIYQANSAVPTDNPELTALVALC